MNLTEIRAGATPASLGCRLILKNENDFRTFIKAKIGVHFADGSVADMGNVAGQGLP